MAFFFHLFCFIHYLLLLNRHCFKLLYNKYIVQNNEMVATPSCLVIVMHTTDFIHILKITMTPLAKSHYKNRPTVCTVYKNCSLFHVHIICKLHTMSTEHVQNNCETYVWWIPLKSCQDLRGAVQKSCQRRSHFLLNHDHNMINIMIKI